MIRLKYRMTVPVPAEQSLHACTSKGCCHMLLRSARQVRCGVRETSDRSRRHGHHVFSHNLQANTRVVLFVIRVPHALLELVSVADLQRRAVL